MRAATGALLACGLTGCFHLPSPPADASGAASCPAVSGAEAWINRMPGPGRTGNALIIVVKLETEERWRLEPAGGAEAGPVLLLELSAGGSGHPGSAGYRAAQVTGRKQVEILCNGRHHHTIAEIIIAS